MLLYLAEAKSAYAVLPNAAAGAAAPMLLLSLHKKPVFSLLQKADISTTNIHGSGFPE
jgi:hypothetical protein